MQTKPLEEKLPPVSLEAEQAVLGSLMMSSEALNELSLFLRPDDFFLARNKFVYEAILALHNASMAIDNVTVAEVLFTRKLLDDIGGHAYISQLVNSIGSHVNVLVYGRMVEATAIRRSLLDRAGSIARIALEDNVTLEEALDRAESTLFEVTQGRRRLTGISLAAAVAARFDSVEYQYNNGHDQPGISTGFPSLDAKLNGRLGKGKLFYVAARPGMGKTALALQIALHAGRQGKKTQIVSMEMDIEELTDRLISYETAIQGEKLTRAMMNEDEWGAFVGAMSTLGELPIWLDDTPGLTMRQIAGVARKRQAESGLDLLIIDYLQLIEPDERYRGNKNLEIAETSRLLKKLARELRIPVICLSQLNREGAEGEPELTHLRDSGSLEQDADVVLFLWSPKGEKNSRNWKIAKQRGGETGSFPMRWNGPLMQFSEMAKPNIPKGQS